MTRTRDHLELEKTARAVRPGDAVEDDSGDARRVAGVETDGRWVVLHDGNGDALIVDRRQKVRVERAPR